jgi:type IV secretion system pilin
MKKIINNLLLVFFGFFIFASPIFATCGDYDPGLGQTWQCEPGTYCSDRQECESTYSPTGPLSTDIDSQITQQGFFNPDLGHFISVVIEVALILASLLTLFMLIWGGIEWVTSGGDKEKYENARKRITAAIIGLAIAACAWAIWLLVIRFLGVDRIPQLQITGSSGNESQNCASLGTLVERDQCYLGQGLCGSIQNPTLTDFCRDEAP